MPQPPLSVSDAMLPIGKIALRTGLAVSAIRHYEDQGLITPIRSAGGTRHFRRADIRRLSFIMIAQRLGLSLSEIRDHLRALPQNKAPSKADWTRLSRDMRAGLDERIAQLTKLRDTLDGCIGCGCLSLKACALYNPEDRDSEAGPGPRKLIS